MIQCGCSAFGSYHLSSCMFTTSGHQGPFRWSDRADSLQFISLDTKVVDLRQHPSEQRFGRRGENTRPLELKDFFLCRLPVSACVQSQTRRIRCRACPAQRFQGSRGTGRNRPLATPNQATVLEQKQSAPLGVVGCAPPTERSDLERPQTSPSWGRFLLVEHFQARYCSAWESNTRWARARSYGAIITGAAFVHLRWSRRARLLSPRLGCLIGTAFVR